MGVVRMPPADIRSQELEIIAYQQNNQPIFRYSDYLPLQGMTGNVEALALYAGQSAGLISEEKEAAVIMADILDEISLGLKDLNNLFSGVS